MGRLQCSPVGLPAQGVCPKSLRWYSLLPIAILLPFIAQHQNRRGLQRGAPRLERVEEARLHHYHRPAPDRRGLRRGAPRLELLERVGEPRLPCACSGSRPRTADSSSSTWV